MPSGPRSSPRRPRRKLFHFICILVCAYIYIILAHLSSSGPIVEARSTGRTPATQGRRQHQTESNHAWSGMYKTITQVDPDPAHLAGPPSLSPSRRLHKSKSLDGHAANQLTRTSSRPIIVATRRLAVSIGPRSQSRDCNGLRNSLDSAVNSYSPSISSGRQSLLCVAYRSRPPPVPCQGSSRVLHFT